MKVIVVIDYGGHTCVYAYNEKNLRHLIQLLIEENNSNTILEDNELKKMEAALADSVFWRDYELEALIPKGIGPHVVAILEIEDTIPNNVW